MLQVDTIDDKKINLDVSIFSVSFNDALVHQVVVAYQANARMATRKQKTRSEIAKSTRKPWRQKGTGRARAGMASSPIWRGGGRAFPSSPNENFSQKVNKKVYRKAIYGILSRLYSEGRIVFVSDDFFTLDLPKTSLFKAKMASFGLSDNKMLFVSDFFSDEFYLASRNIPNIGIGGVSDLNPVALIFFDKLILSESAVKTLVENYNE